MKAVDKFLDIMGFTEIKEEVITEEETIIEEPVELKQRKPKGQLFPLNTNREQVKVVLIEPIVFDDCQTIADSLKNKRTVIINLENLDLASARRIIDFVGGTAYAIGGTLQKVGTGIIIAVPSNVDITGDINSMSQPKEVFAWINKLTQSADFNRK